MNVVYPITALYWGPVALCFFARHGRRQAKPVIQRHGPPNPDDMPRWVILSKAVNHCGACAGHAPGGWMS